MGRSPHPRVHTACSQCGKLFSVNKAEYANRLKRSKSGTIFCSKKCYDEWQRKPNKSPVDIPV